MVALLKDVPRFCMVCSARLERRPREAQKRFEQKRVCSQKCQHALLSQSKMVHPEPKPCVICTGEIVRRDGDRLSDFKRRSTCSKECTSKLLAQRTSAARRPASEAREQQKREKDAARQALARQRLALKRDIAEAKRARIAERKAKQQALAMPRECDCGNLCRVEVRYVEYPRANGKSHKERRVFHEEACDRCMAADGTDATSADVISALRSLGGSSLIDGIAEELGGGDAGHRQAYRGLALLRTTGRVKVYSCDGELLPANTAASSSNAHGYPFTYVLKEKW